jgi:hypothetical protein
MFATICRAQSNAPLSLEWGMSREEAGARLSIQHGLHEKRENGGEVYSGIKLGQFENCKTVLFFAGEELAAVKIESFKPQNWTEQIRNLAAMFTSVHGRPLGGEVNFKSLESGVELTWEVARVDGQPVNITLEANHNGFTLTYLDVLRTAGILTQGQTLTLGMGWR